MDVRRIHPNENAPAIAAEQVRALLRARPTIQSPLVVFDAGYDPERLARELGAAPVAVLIRLRRDRCFYAAPRRQPPTGRPHRHGAQFVCKDPATWPGPTAEHTANDGQYGRVRVRAWAGLHAKSQNHPGRGTHKPRPLLRGTVVRVEVARLPQKTRAPQQRGLWWHGPGDPDLDLLWRASVRRFDREPTFRFGGQALHWTVPRVRHPAQADCWTWLVALGYPEPRLARPLVCEQRLPWQAPMADGALTPYRGRHAFSTLLAPLGPPARPPQPGGRSPAAPRAGAPAPHGGIPPSRRPPERSITSALTTSRRFPAHRSHSRG